MATKGLNIVTIAGQVTGLGVGAGENKGNKTPLVQLKNISSNLTSTVSQSINFYNLNGIKTHDIHTYTSKSGYYALIFQIDPYQLPHMASNARYEIYATAQWKSSPNLVYARGAFSCSISLGQLAGGGPGLSVPQLTGTALEIWNIVREHVKLPSRLIAMAKSPIAMNHLVYMAKPKTLNLLMG